MASSFIISTVLLLLTVINTVVTGVPEREYRSMLAALRFRGYHLFANAISTTDLHYDIINGDNFTFFAPIDSALYALDMSISAADYTTVLRFHSVPRRLSFTDLRLLVFRSDSVPSLVPGHEIHVVNPLTLRSPITVEGVDIAFPGLFYGTYIAVHGLEGIMDFRSLKDTMDSASAAANLTENLAPMNVHSEDLAPSASPSPSPSPESLAPVPATSPRSSIVTPIGAASAPDISLANRISVPGAQRYHQPETRSESVRSVTQPRQPETKSESITQPNSPEIKSESITQSRPPETRSESVTQPRRPETESESITQPHRPETKSESITQPRRVHRSMITRSEFFSRKLGDVSLATKLIGNSAEDFTQVDDKTIDWPMDDDCGEQVKIANVRRGYLYTRELFTPTIMTCVHE
ncbi:hypothetical protein SSX86_009582 [Deinandra increscens subsp. villosa]|uniref:FAS1 domain-containing protein n=1 Tax=Deinandra increscens subsp. villosa TaxID=3103831 RepID=A0AAP0D9U3_9ASTR